MGGMRQRNQMVSAADMRGGLAQASIGRAAEELSQPVMIQVVHGDNKELSIRWTAFAVFAWASVFFVIMYGIRMQTAWDWGKVVTAWGLGSLVGIPVILFIASGDIPVLRQIGRTAKLESKRLGLAADIAMEWTDIERQRSEWEHDEKMAGIKLDAEIEAVKVRMMLLEDKMHLGTQPEEGLASPGYTPGEVTEARKLVAKYVLGDMRSGKPGLYKRGLLDPNKINPNTGQFTLDEPLPWSKRGAWRGENSREGYRIMREPAVGAEPLIIEEQVNGRTVGYRWNIEHYNLKADAYHVIGAVA